jgi:hypothetical protein
LLRPSVEILFLTHFLGYRKRKREEKEKDGRDFEQFAAESDRNPARSPGARAAQTRHFTSVEDLQAKVFAFIDYDNRTMAKPFKWTHQSKALTA